MSRDARGATRMLSAMEADAAGDAARDAAAVELRPLDQGRAVAIAVRAQPGSRRAGVLGTRNAALRLGVSAPPEDGRANADLVRLLASLFDLPRSAVSLVAGERSRDKTFRLDAPVERIRRRLDELLQE